VLKRPILAVSGIALAASLAACSSSGSAAPTSGHGTAGGATPTNAGELGAKLAASFRSVTSTHMQLSVKAGAVSLNGSGDEKVSNGKVTALDLSETVPQVGNLSIVNVGGKTYVKLPPSENTGSKPWVLVSAQSKNPAIAQMASSLNQSLSAASINTYDSFVKAAKSVQVKGHETVNGVGTTHYLVVVDVKKLPTTSAFSQQALAASGLKTIPLDLWVDGQGRPIKFDANLSVQGQKVGIAATLSKYNQPVTITAPPANQVSTG
jgi:hypothetical protein